MIWIIPIKRIKEKGKRERPWKNWPETIRDDLRHVGIVVERGQGTGDGKGCKLTHAMTGMGRLSTNYIEPLYIAQSIRR